ncbi:hypothetical protein ODZ84_00645 [Chryseobacterium fluminis]|uniref:hypothetical protein n=1 Tax=Chryseobacterium fluminis TaxID=2983606 RepID=UPI002254A6C4|nr:hypothetical protein [Chryseobacterium sp. MMS21-Ot14]UZT98112.1 hypothetical protein ODZ84_00645 [Chryseobacterium sp. MMS21-Ot14]
MKKNVLSLMVAATLLTARLTAQVGINTANPQGVFSVDGAKDNPATGTPTATQQLNDFSVTPAGNVGIGNVAPAARLDIVGDTFGIKKSQGSGSWDNFWINLSDSQAPAIIASGADAGLQFKVGVNTTGTYGNGQTLTTVATMTPAGNVGIGVAAPTDRLDVNGKVRVRTISPVTDNTTVNPVYTDTNGVLVKTSAGETFGSVVSNQSASIASGATGTLISGLPNRGIYKAVIIVGDGCAHTTIGEFRVICNAFNGYFGIRGVTGLLSSSDTKAPSFTETNKATTGVTWPGNILCQDGGDSTALDYTLTMPNASTINITNNGNVPRSYRIILTKYN